MNRNDDPIVQLLQEISSSLKELVVLTRIQANEHMEQLLRTEFFDKDSPKQDRIQVYQYLYQGFSQRKIAGILKGVSQPTISGWFKRWRKIGLADDSGVLFDLSDFLPNLKR